MPLRFARSWSEKIVGRRDANKATGTCHESAQQEMSRCFGSKSFGFGFTLTLPPGTSTLWFKEFWFYTDPPPPWDLQLRSDPPSYALGATFSIRVMTWQLGFPERACPTLPCGPRRAARETVGNARPRSKGDVSNQLDVWAREDRSLSVDLFSEAVRRRRRNATSASALRSEKGREGAIWIESEKSGARICGSQRQQRLSCTDCIFSRENRCVQQAVFAQCRPIRDSV